MTSRQSHAWTPQEIERLEQFWHSHRKQRVPWNAMAAYVGRTRYACKKYVLSHQEQFPPSVVPSEATHEKCCSGCTCCGDLTRTLKRVRDLLESVSSPEVAEKMAAASPEQQIDVFVRWTKNCTEQSEQ